MKGRDADSIDAVTSSLRALLALSVSVRSPQGRGTRHPVFAMPLRRLALELAVRETFEVPCSAAVVS